MACVPCQITYNDQTGDKHCMMCNSELDPAHYIEVGTPIGQSSYHGVLSGVLCEECAEEIARIINNATNGAREQMMDNLRT